MDRSFPEPTDADRTQVTANTGDSDGMSCGELLRRARERRGLTLEYVANATKLPLRHLHALERDEFAALPGGLYRRAEVGAYADAVGLNRRIALASLHHTLEQTEPRPPVSVQRAGRPWVLFSLPVRLGMMVAVATIPCAIALAMWTSRSVAQDLPNIQSMRALPTRTIEPTILTHAQPQLERFPPAVVTSPMEGQLTVITDPTGARVTVNGVGRGVTPVTVRQLTAGLTTVRVTMDGYVTEERRLRLDAGVGVTSVRIPMRTQQHDGDASPDEAVGLDGTR
jgi:hypothetical protein